MIALNPIDVAVDAADFQAALAEGSPQALVRAAKLYKGDLLDGFSLDEVPFERWRVVERERLHELALEGLTKLLREHLGAQRLESAIHTALQLLALDPLQEVVHRTLIRLFLREGRRAAALRQYQECVRTLERELGVGPEEDTRRLYREALQASHAPAAIASLSVRTATATPDAPTREPLLIGRHTETARLRAALDEARGGKAPLVAVLGEAGIGKSRLVTDVSQVGLASVLVGRAYESTRAVPFGLWVDLLRTGGVAEDRSLLVAVGSTYRAELARLLPELGAPGLTLPSTPDGAVRIFQAVTRVLRHLAARDPLMIVLEDLHWADDMSLRLLSFVSRQVETSPVLIVVTAREEDLADAPILGQLLAERNREGRLLALNLGRLSQDDTRALAEALTRPGSPVREHMEWVWTTSEGNPFIAIETVRALGQAPAGREPGATALTPRVRELLAERLTRLGLRAHELLATAAVIGRRFDFELLQRAGGLNPAETAEAVEELVRRHVLQSLGDELDFTHDRIRDHVYEGILPVRRRVLHGSVAVALEALYEDSPDAVADRLALHYAEAGDPDRAVHHLTRAAELASRKYAHAQSVALLRDSVSWLDRLPAGPERDWQRIELVLRTAESLFFLGRFREGVDVLVAEEKRLVDLPDGGLAARYHFWLANLYTRLNAHDLAVEHAWRAIEMARDAGDAGTVGKAYGVLGVEAYWAGDGVRGIEVGRQGVALLEGTGERWWLAMGCFYLGLNHLFMGDFDPALEAEARVRAIGEELGDPRLQSFADLATGMVLTARGEAEPAVAACRRSLSAAPDPVSRAYATAHLGYAHLERGDHGDALRHLEDAVEQIGRFGVRQWEGYFMTLLGEVHLAAGNRARAEELVRQGLALTREAGNRFGVGWAERALGRTASARGAPEEAERHLAEALATFGAIGSACEAARTAVALAEVIAVRGDVAAAAALLADGYRTFIARKAPVLVARSEAVAARLGITLPAA
jgi:tetratricopeptide (TPR) repeat protein